MARSQRTAKLTKRSVEAIQPPDKGDVIVWDTEIKGFGVKVMHTGRRKFLLYYRTTGGQQRKPTIGEFGTITCEQARRKAIEWLAEVHKGGDPSGDRQAYRRAETVSELCDRYLEDYAAIHKKAASIDSDKRNIENHVRPLLGQTKVKDVSRADIERVKLAIAKGKTARAEKGDKPRGRRVVKGGKIVSNRVVALLSKMFHCAMEWGLRTDNPASRVQKFKERPRDRFLDAKEVHSLHEALDACEQDKTITRFAAAAIKLLLYTGMRRGEVTGLQWKDVDFDHGCLRLPDSKTGQKTIYLGAPALELLSELPEGGEDDFVFLSGKRGAPITLTRPWQVVRKRAEIGEDATLHTLRHTFASWAVMGGFGLARTGAMLGHRAAQTTMRYAHHDKHPLQQAANQVSATLEAMADESFDPHKPEDDEDSNKVVRFPRRERQR